MAFKTIFCLLLLTAGLQPCSYSVTPFFSSDHFQDTVKSGQTANKQPVYTTQRLSTRPPVIDGILNDDCWKTGTWAGDFTQWIPNEGTKPTYPTELNIQYDDKFLYVAIRAFDGEPEV